MGKLWPWRNNYGDSVDFVDPSFCFHEDTWWTPLTCLFIKRLPVTPFPARSPSIIYGNATIPLSICHGWKADPQQVLAETTNRPFATQMGRSAARFIGGSGVTLCAYKVSYRLSVLIGIPRMCLSTPNAGVISTAAASASSLRW